MSRASRKQRKKIRAAKMWMERASVAALAWVRLSPEDPTYDALGTVWLGAETCCVQALANVFGFRGSDRQFFRRHSDVYRFQLRDWLRERGL